MKNFLLSSLGLLLSLNIYAQEFLSGEVAFTNQEIAKGKIAVDFNTNTVIIKSGEEHRVYHASIISQVSILSPNGGMMIYKVYQQRDPGLLIQPENRIFQVVTFGKISLLKRGIGFATTEDGDGFTVYDWYLQKDKELELIINFKRQLFDQMNNFGEEMHSYIHCEEIENMKNGDALYEIVSYYNRLSNGQQPTKKSLQVNTPES